MCVAHFEIICQLFINQYHFCSMNNKLSITYLILIIAPLFFGCGGPVTKENKNNVSASSLSLHVGNEKYFIIDTKETVAAWTVSSVHGGNTGYVYVSKGELMIEKGQLVGGAVEVDMNTIEDKNHGNDHRRSRSCRNDAH